MTIKYTDAKELQQYAKDNLNLKLGFSINKDSELVFFELKGDL